MINIPKFIVIHCTDYPRRLIPDQMVACEGWHKDRDFPISSLGLHIGYHRLITGESNYKCREDYDVGAHCNQQFEGKSLNFQSLGVCIGFDGDEEMPTSIEYDLLKKQVWEWQDKYSIPNNRVVFHRYFSKDKTCPGNLINNFWLENLLKREQVTSKFDVLEKEKACINEVEDLKVTLKWYQRLLTKFKVVW